MSDRQSARIKVDDRQTKKKCFVFFHFTCGSHCSLCSSSFPRACALLFSVGSVCAVGQLYFLCFPALVAFTCVLDGPCSLVSRPYFLTVLFSVTQFVSSTLVFCSPAASFSSPDSSLPLVYRQFSFTLSLQSLILPVKNHTTLPLSLSSLSSFKDLYQI